MKCIFKILWLSCGEWLVVGEVKGEDVSWTRVKMNSSKCPFLREIHTLLAQIGHL